MAPTVALATCSELPDLDPDERLVLAPLASLGIDARAAVWDDPAEDWSAYDLVVVRSTWDYVERRTEFLAWTRSVPRLANPAPVIAWNTDKRYLADLAHAGVPVVETTWVEPGADLGMADSGRVVVKPAVGAGSIEAGRYDLADEHERRLAAEHAARLAAAGNTAMVQPYLGAVDTHGELALLFVGGRYSHSVRKGAMLAGPAASTGALYHPETIGAREASSREIAVAERAIAAAPGNHDLLYARVDLLADDDGGLVVLELELTEPSLFLGHAPGSEQRLARAIAAMIGVTTG